MFATENIFPKDMLQEQILCLLKIFCRKKLFYRIICNKKVPELNCNNAEMILNKQCHLPFSLLIGNPGSPVMKVGCSPSTVWKRRKKKEHVKFIFRGKNWISFFAPTTSILLSTQKIQPYTLFHIMIKNIHTFHFLMAEFRQFSFKIVG